MAISLLQLPDTDIRKGTLDKTPLSFVLGVARIWSVTGVLTVERNKARKQVFFLEGLPVYCMSELSGESLRQVMFKAGKIDRRGLSEVEALMEKNNVEEDRALLELGMLDERSRYFHLQEQARKRLLALFAWAQGCYSFEATENFLERVDLFDIDPLQIICEAISTYHVLDVPGILQEAASQVVEATEILEETTPFVERRYPEARLDSISGEKAALGDVLRRLHPDISKSMELAFILLISGSMVINGKMPGENNPPVEVAGQERAEDTAPQEGGEAAICADPWEGEVEAPDLDDEDIANMKTEAPLSRDRASDAEHKETKPGKVSEFPGEDKKTSRPPPEPPWKKRRKKPEQPSRFKVTYTLKRTAQPAKPEKKPPSRSRPEAAREKAETEKHFRKMLEVIRRGDPFEILRVPPEAQAAEIKKAYFHLHSQLKLEKNRSPDTGDDKIADELQRGLQNAYDTLLDPNKRFEYEMGLFADERKKAWSLQLMKELANKQWKRGKWYLSHREPELALKFFDTATDLDTEQAPYYAFLGWAQYVTRSAEIAASKSYIRTALGINPKYAEAHLFLGWINKDQGDEKAALECFREAAECDPYNVFARQELEKMSHGKKPGSRGLLDKFFKK